MTGLSTTPPQLESSSSLRRAAAQCTAELLADAGRSTSCLSLVPPVRAGILREHKLDEYDVRIDVPLPRSLAHDANGVQLINPSVHCRDGRLLLAARAMWAVTVQPPCTDVWRSHTILTSISFDKRARTMTLARAPNGTFTGGSRACIADLTAGRKGDIYDHDEAGDEGDDSDGGGGKVHSDGGNSSVLEGGGSDGNAQAARCARLGLPHSVGLGMEDPRLFDITAAAASTAAVAAAATAAAAPDAAAVGSGLLISFSAPRRQQITNCEELSNRRTMSLMPLQPLAPPTPLKWSVTADASDRNWLLFQQHGELFSVFSIEPHIVLRIGRGGACEERHRTSNKYFARKFPNRAIHGGANPLRVSTSKRSHYYVGIFHTKDASLQYENYAYSFSAEPPFRIRAISRKPLVLQGRRVRFVSSLTYLGHSHVIDEAMVGVSYGSDDVEGRFVILPMRVLLQNLVDVSAHSLDLPISLAGAGGAGLTASDGEAAGGASAPLVSNRLQLPFEREQGAGLSHPSLASARASRVVSVGANEDGPGNCFLMPQVRFDAPSIKMVPASAATECCRLCKGVAYCTAFSWSPQDGGACWLKQWTGTATFRDGFISGHFGRRASCACDVSHNTALRLPANHSLDVRVPGSAHPLISCCTACMEHDDCGAWTWSQQRGGCKLYRPPPTQSSGLYVHAPQSVSSVVSLKRSVLFVHNHPPQQRLGSDRRLLALVQQVQRLGWSVSYAGAEAYDPGPVTGQTLLSQMGIPLLSPVSKPGALAAFARTHDVSVVVLCLWFWGKQSVPQRYMRSLRNKMPQLKLVVMSDDVHHQRLQLETEDAGRSVGTEVKTLKEEELRHYFYADHVLTISEVDKAGIISSLPTSRAMHESRFSTLRHVYADGVIFPLERSKSFDQRNGLIFVGNLNNPTNLYSMRWFIREVWPQVRRAEPRMTLQVVGSLDGESARRSGLLELLRASPGVTVSGYVADSDMGHSLQQARVFIAPIRWATGIVTKQTLAHVHGLPSVVTPSAAQHIAPAPLDESGRGDVWSHIQGRYVLVKVAAVAETSTDYAAAILNIHSNSSAWEELSRNGARYARSGGGGKGVCPAGLSDDWLAFWGKLQTGCCTGVFK